MCDSSSGICLAQNPIFQGRAKYIKVRYHFLKDHVEKQDIVMKYIDTERQLADIFTKPLDASLFCFFAGGLDVCHPYGLLLRGAFVLPCIYSILYPFAVLLHFLHTHLS
jgi:hypothetical protein